MNDESTAAGGADGALEEASQLLVQQLASAASAAPSPSADGVRQRLLQRAADSAAAEHAFHTVRGAEDWCCVDGLATRWLYRCTDPSVLRAGEPLRVRLVELAAGETCRLATDEADCRVEWLVVSGEAQVEDTSLAARDYHVISTGPRGFALHSARGARLLVREAPAPAGERAQHTVPDREASWEALSPHVERRVLCQWGTEAALLYRVWPGVDVPHHGHGHDEECLLLEGEVFVDDVLLRAGEYQLAPAGTMHAGVSSDTGGILFAHGDIELALSAS